MSLTDNQQIALEQLQNFVTQKNDRFFKLFGAAGSGKTYLVSQFLAWYQNNFSGNKIAAVAPSHKARKNLQELLDTAEVTIDKCSTVASFLGMAPMLDENSGKEVFAEIGKLTGDLPSDYDLIIVDEAPMLIKETIVKICTQTTRLTKVIFVGDSAQIPPIGESISYLEAIETSVWPCARLTEVVRYSGDLARIAHSNRVEYRIDPNTGQVVKLDPIAPLPIVATADNSISELKKHEFIDSLVRDIIAGKDSKLIAWTNPACKVWNEAIRNKLREFHYFDGIFDDFAINDKLIARKPISRKKPNGEKEVIFENSSDFTITLEPEYTKHELLDTRLFMWKIPIDRHIELFENVENQFVLNVLADDSIKQYKDLLNNLATEAKNSAPAGRKKLWGIYHYAANYFDDVVHSYAITNHKAQGSTLDSVYLDLVNLSKCPDKYQMFYTAMTRSKQIYIF